MACTFPRYWKMRRLGGKVVVGWESLSDNSVRDGEGFVDCEKSLQAWVFERSIEGSEGSRLGKAVRGPAYSHGLEGWGHIFSW
jgi:hypothetical protein